LDHSVHRKRILFKGGQEKSRRSGQSGAASAGTAADGVLTLLNHLYEPTWITSRCFLRQSFNMSQNRPGPIFMSALNNSGFFHIAEQGF
jgi:hypothetical protein